MCFGGLVIGGWALEIQIKKKYIYCSAHLHGCSNWPRLCHNGAFCLHGELAGLRSCFNVHHLIRDPELVRHRPKHNSYRGMLCGIGWDWWSGKATSSYCSASQCNKWLWFSSGSTSWQRAVSSRQIQWNRMASPLSWDHQEEQAPVAGPPLNLGVSIEFQAWTSDCHPLCIQIVPED